MNNIRLAFAGNPNCGKTTLFNSLTGERHRVGNWPGVTIDRKEGGYRYKDQSYVVVDLPGTYSLDTSYNSGLDEAIARDYILTGEADLVVNVVDASNLERNLYLTTQLLDMRVPMVVALTKTDAARRQGMEIDVDALAIRLGMPVVALCPQDQAGRDRLKEVISAAVERREISDVSISYPDAIEAALPGLIADLALSADRAGVDERWLAIKALGGDSKALSFLDEPAREKLDAVLEQLINDSGDDADLLIADGRYGFANSLAQSVTRYIGRLTTTWTERIDSVILNRLFGIPIFLMIMYLMFLLTINFASAFIDFFDILAGTLLESMCPAPS